MTKDTSKGIFPEKMQDLGKKAKKKLSGVVEKTQKLLSRSLEKVNKLPQKSKKTVGAVAATAIVMTGVGIRNCDSNPSTQECRELAHNKEVPVIDFWEKSVIMPYHGDKDTCTVTFSKKGNEIHYTISSNIKSSEEEGGITNASKKTFTSRVHDGINKITEEGKAKGAIDKNAEKVYNYLQLLKEMKKLDIEVDGEKMRFNIDYITNNTCTSWKVKISKTKEGYKLNIYDEGLFWIGGEKYKCKTIEEVINTIEEYFSHLLPSEWNDYKVKWNDSALESFDGKMKATWDFFEYLEEIN